MAIQKKHGKGRLDKWYKLAKEKGYRARAAFKLIQLNKKYGFLEKSKVLLDLCAAPGSWCQVAAEVMPVNSLIVGVDLSPIKPIPRVITVQSDITTDQCRATIRKHLKTWKADTVLHDGAPNVGTAWVLDSFNQAELVLQAMKLATEFLMEGGTFVTKVFRSKDYNSLLWVFQQLFAKVEATKPPSSRHVSAEIFVVCRGFKAPKRIDPKFLDARAVFEELAAPTPNNEAKVYNPEIKKRKRDGYEEGNWTQFKEKPASEFIQCTDPISILATVNKLHFDRTQNGDVMLAALDKLPQTTDDIRRCCEDLKVLGRKEFKILLRWRLKVRDIFGFPSSRETAVACADVVEETADVESMDEEMRIQQDLQALKDRQDSRKKKERRRQNEKRQRDIVRMQLNMTAPMDIGMEQQGPMGEDAMFQLQAVEKEDGVLKRIAKGNMMKVRESQPKKEVAVSESESDEEDGLERELDGMYESYKDRKAATDAKYRAKLSRKEHADDEWEGISGNEQAVSEEESELEEEEDSEEESDEEMTDGDQGPAHESLLADLDKESARSGLSKRARAFFNQDLFQDIEGLEDEPEEEDKESGIVEPSKVATLNTNDDDDKSKIQIFKGPQQQPKKDRGDESDWEGEENRRRNKEKGARPEIDIITAEAMALAHELATGRKSSHEVVDDMFHKHAFRDREGLPEWFVEDESQHDRPHRPITKAAAQAIRDKQRALNARPIKKVREAKARKKLRAADRLEKLRKKSDVLAASEGMTEREKAESISKLLAKASKKIKRPAVKVVVARGTNRGKGRPAGVKGRYRMVDARMKKEVRALKRKAKESKR